MPEIAASCAPSRSPRPSQRPLASAARSVTAANASHWQTLAVAGLPHVTSLEAARREPAGRRAELVAVRTGCYPEPQMAPETPVFQAYCGSEEPRFANEAELECAKILDYYGVPWEYEPRTFVLEQDERGASSRRSHLTSTCPSRISTSS